MPVIYSDYKIMCPYYGSTRGLRIVCLNGFTIEFRKKQDMENWKEHNCNKITGAKCRARKLLDNDLQNHADKGDESDESMFCL